MSDNILIHKQIEELQDKTNQLHEKIDLIFGILTGQVKPEELMQELSENTMPSTEQPVQEIPPGDDAPLGNVEQQGNDVNLPEY